MLKRVLFFSLMAALFVCTLAGLAAANARVTGPAASSASVIWGGGYTDPAPQGGIWGGGRPGPTRLGDVSRLASPMELNISIQHTQRPPSFTHWLDWLQIFLTPR